MKKTMLSILLACQLVASLALTGLAATDQVTYHIGSISPVGYLLDDDTSRVDFQDSADGATVVRYGETVYFPLRNNGAAAGASEEQLLTRSARLSADLEQSDAYLDTLKQEYDAAGRNLESALDAAMRARTQLVSDLEGLIDAIDAETTDADSREAEIASLRSDLAGQRISLDSAIELDSAAEEALTAILPEIELAKRELKALQGLVGPVREREALEERQETLETAIQDSGDLLEQIEGEMENPTRTTAALTAAANRLSAEIEAAEEAVERVFEVELSPFLEGSLTNANYEDVYEPYLEARDNFRERPADERLDSGIEDYLEDSRPDPHDYPETVVDYGEAIKELLSTYLGTDDFDQSSQSAARDVALDLSSIGRGDDTPDENGSLHAQINYWEERQRQLEEDLETLSAELALSRDRDKAASGLRALEQDQAELTRAWETCRDEIAALAAQAPTLSLDPEALTSHSLGEENDGWETNSMIGSQQDRLFTLLEEQSDLGKEKDAAAETVREEQALFDEINRKLTALTDPDAPSATTHATRLRQNYPFLLFSQTFKDANKIEALDSDAVREELDDLLGLFSQEDLQNDGPESDGALLQKIRVYENYTTARETYERQLPRGKELLRSVQAAALAYEQTGPESEKYPYVYENKAVDGVKLKSKWEEGKRYVDEISLVKKRYQHDSGYTGTIPSAYIYFIALKTKDRDTTSTGTVELFGTISMKKSSRGDSLRAFDYDEMELEVNLELGFDHPDDANLIPVDPATFYPDEDFDEGDDETFDFEADDDSYYVANTNSQKKLVLGMNTDYDEEIGDLYAEQTNNLCFWNGNGGSFNRSGYLYLAADEDSFLYRINDQGVLIPVRAEYDDYENCFVIRTRALGRYAVSDVELDLIDPMEDDPEEQVVTVITPDDAESTTLPTAPSQPSPGWSQGSRSDESEAPVSSSEASFEPEASSSSGFVVSSPEQLPTAGETDDISVLLLIGISIAGALILTIAVVLIIGAKSGKLRKP